MRKKGNNYSTPNSSGWLNSSLELFMSRYKGQPCEICGRRSGYSNGKSVRSCAHHLIFQSQSRQHKFSHENILVLCPYHHSQFNPEISPHSIVSTDAQGLFREWVRDNKPEQFAWWQEHKGDEYDKSVTARDIYEQLGGEIRKIDSNGNKLPMKDWHPVNHRKNVILTIDKYGGLLSKSESQELAKWRKS